MSALALTAPAMRPTLKISTQSRVGDMIWRLDGARPGAHRADFNLRWDFTLPNGDNFAAKRFDAWRDAAKLFLVSLRFDPPAGRGSLKESSLVGMFKLLRVLVRWMASKGVFSFLDLDAQMAERFIASIAIRPGKRQRIAEPTLYGYRRMLCDLHLQGGKYPELACSEPFPGAAPFSGGKRGNQPIPHTPDEIAVPLVAAALRLIGAPADDVLTLHARAQGAYDDAISAGISQTKAGFIVVDAIADFSASSKRGLTRASFKRRATCCGETPNRAAMASGPSPAWTSAS